VNFRNLEVYQLSIRFVAVASRLANGVPASYGDARDQLRRASTSIPVNIAEGSGKTTRPDQRRFYAIARGSAMECAAWLDVCRVLDHPDKSALEEGDALLGSIVRMLSVLARG
jgi:four helix bundle protein